MDDKAIEFVNSSLEESWDLLTSAYATLHEIANLYTEDELTEINDKWANIESLADDIDSLTAELNKLKMD